MSRRHTGLMKTFTRRVSACVCLFFVGLFAIACSDDGDPGAAITAQTPTSTPAGDPASPSTTSTPVTGSATPTSGLPNSVNLTRVFPNVSIARGTGLYQGPDGRWYATEQLGRILT